VKKAKSGEDPWENSDFSGMLSAAGAEGLVEKP
jgi:hypothetical protein